MLEFFISIDHAKGPNGKILKAKTAEYLPRRAIFEGQLIGEY